MEIKKNLLRSLLILPLSALQKGSGNSFLLSLKAERESFSFLNTDAVGKCHSSDASLSLGAARAAPISWPLCRDDGN